jgi:hypothetical protein
MLFDGSREGVGQLRERHLGIPIPKLYTGGRPKALRHYLAPGLALKRDRELM